MDTTQAIIGLEIGYNLKINSKEAPELKSQ